VENENQPDNGDQELEDQKKAEGMEVKRFENQERNGLPLMELSQGSNLPESFKVDCQKSQIEK